jgi:hypothetical protein
MLLATRDKDRTPRRVAMLRYGGGTLTASMVVCKSSVDLALGEVSFLDMC